MTVLMDKFFIAIGLDSEEIKESSGRGVLYIGIVFMSGASAAFMLMAIFGQN
jgi:hypothetical protein